MFQKRLIKMKVAKRWIMLQLNGDRLTDHEKLNLLSGHDCKTVDELKQVVIDWPNDFFEMDE